MLQATVGVTAVPAPDHRTQKLITRAAANLSRSLGMREAAETIGLSPSRASHLFVEQTGIPFRTYVLWLRLTRAVDEYASGASLTDAAHEAGFTDSAHLSRTVKRMFEPARFGARGKIAVSFKRACGDPR